MPGLTKPGECNIYGPKFMRFYYGSSPKYLFTASLTWKKQIWKPSKKKYVKIWLEIVKIGQNDYKDSNDKLADGC